MNFNYFRVSFYSGRYHVKFKSDTFNTKFSVDDGTSLEEILQIIEREWFENAQ